MTRMLWLLAGLILLANAGCQTLADFTTPGDEKPSTGKPNEIGAIWQEGVDIQYDPNQGGNPVPGFAGRVFFMRKSGKFSETVLVNNPVVISLYDDRPYNGPPQPLETWTILPEHLPLLVKKDMTGWGYSIWLPWHTYYPGLQNVRMIVEYQDKNGGKLHSDPSPINIQNNNGGLPKPQLKVEKNSKNTWQQ